MLQDRDGNLWFGTWGGGASRYDGENWRNFSTQDGLAHSNVNAIFQDREGNLWFATGSYWGRFRPGVRGLSRYDGKTFRTVTTKDGPGNNFVLSILQDRDGDLWFGTWDGGVSRYDGQKWRTFTVEDGLADNVVSSVLQDREGNLWFGTQGGGVSRYSGQVWTTFTEADGLRNSSTAFLFQDRDENLWVGADAGYTRFDGRRWTAFSAKDGFPDTRPRSIYQDREGNLWFATNGGVSRYDPGQAAFTAFTTADGLAHKDVRSVYQDAEGYYWYTHGGRRGVSRYNPSTSTFAFFGPEDGLMNSGAHYSRIIEDRNGNLWFGPSRYDGQNFTTFTTQDGLASNDVRINIVDRSGKYWMAHGWAGATRYDGRAFEVFTQEDGLSGDDVRSVFQDQQGHIWFGIGGGGATRYDGQVFQTLTKRDGLASNHVRDVFQDRRGNFWFATNSGLTRLRPPKQSPPPVFVEAVVADRRYEAASEVAVSATVALIGFEFRGVSLKTRPGAMVYRYRLNGYHDWRTTREQRVEYQDLPRGDYTFEVEAVDRDLVYSESPAVVALTVHVPYERMGLWSGLVIAVVLVGWQTTRVVRRDRRLRGGNQALSDANKELFQVNVDLQREQVLERLRGQAQGMQSSEDIGPAVEAVYRELTELGLPLIWSGVYIILSDTEFENWVVGEYGRALEPVIVEKPPPPNRIHEARLRGDSYWHGHVEGEEVKKDLRHSIERGNPRWKGLSEDQWPQKLDNYYVFFDGGGVTVHSEEPIAEEYLMLIKRFGEVFGYAHSRREELKQKEAQNRELTVEAALERVRARALGMQESTDIGDVAKVLFEEMLRLGFEPTRSAISIVQDLESMTMKHWWGERSIVGIGDNRRAVLSEETSVRSSGIFSGPPHSPPWADAWKEGKTPNLTIRRDGDEVERYETRRISSMSDAEREAYLNLFEHGQFHYFFFFKHGWLSPILTSELSEDNIRVGERFAQVFELAYGRFEELQQKEAQNRQLITEAALERVRSSVTSMVAAADLGGVVEQMLEELETSGVDFDLCVINIIDEGAGVRRQYGATPQGWSGQVEVPLSEVSEGFLALWREGKPVAREVDDALAQACFETRSQMGVTGEMVRPTAVVDAPFAYGTLSLQSHKTEGLSEEDIDVVAEFARVVALGYARFLDFENLERQNQELQRDRAVERIRGEVQSMEKAEDFERVLSLLTEDLKAVGLDFESCEIDVLEEPVDNPTTQFFEEKGFRYTTYTLNPDGHVASEAFAIPAPFPGVIRQTVERFVAGEPWQGTSEGQAIVEVPAGSYGRLRLTATGRDSFDDDEVATLKQFTDAVALGYARYLDIREIQEQTERKSAFLASMSHELRTPMNAHATLGAAAVSVRSSTSAEDLEDASFAGLYDSFLNIRTLAEVFRRVKQVWASFYAPHAIEYRLRHGIPHDGAGMAVVVQRQIVPDASGVLFTRDPITGENRCVVSAALGLGEGVVSGMAETDRFILIPRSGRLVSSEVVSKETCVAPSQRGGVETVDVSGRESDRPCLTPTRLRQLVATGRKLVELLGGPQDIEFAVTGRRVHILQSRPMTALQLAVVPEELWDASLDRRRAWRRGWEGLLYRLQETSYGKLTIRCGRVSKRPAWAWSKAICSISSTDTSTRRGPESAREKSRGGRRSRQVVWKRPKRTGNPTSRAFCETVSRSDWPP